MNETCGGCAHFSVEPNIGDRAHLPAGFGRCLQSVNYRFKSPGASCQFNPSRFVAAPQPFALTPPPV
jgi:hypothetical protein